MAALKALAAAAFVFVAAPASAEPVDAWHAFIAQAAARFGVPEVWILQVMRAESGGRTQLAGLPIRSRAGAMGLMQLMPSTWIAMRDAYRLGPDPDDPHDNIFAGTAYLRMMYDAFGYPGLFAGYNAGPNRYAAYLQRGGRLPAETRAYVARVAPHGASDRSRIAPPVLVFAIRHSEPDAQRRSPTSVFAVYRSVPTSVAPVEISRQGETIFALLR